MADTRSRHNLEQRVAQQVKKQLKKLSRLRTTLDSGSSLKPVLLVPTSGMERGIHPPY